MAMTSPYIVKIIRFSEKKNINNKKRNVKLVPNYTSTFNQIFLVKQSIESVQSYYIEQYIPVRLRV